MTEVRYPGLEAAAVRGCEADGRFRCDFVRHLDTDAAGARSVVEALKLDPGNDLSGRRGVSRGRRRRHGNEPDSIPGESPCRLSVGIENVGGPYNDLVEAFKTVRLGTLLGLSRELLILRILCLLFCWSSMTFHILSILLCNIARAVVGVLTLFVRGRLHFILTILLVAPKERVAAALTGGSAAGVSLFSVLLR